MDEWSSMASEVPNGQTLKEQERRASVKTYIDERSPDEVPQFSASKHDGPSFEVRLPEQNFVLYSISSEGLAPISLTPKYPNIRIYGCFPSKEDAVEYAKVVRSVDPHCSLMAHPVGEWALVAANAESLANAPQDVRARVEQYEQQRKMSTAEFASNVKNKKQGNTRDVSKAPDACVEVSKRPETASVYQRVLGANARIANQSVAVVSVIRDSEDETPTQPIFMLHACFANTEDADRYVRDTLSPLQPDIDIDIIMTGEWISPQLAIDHPNCLYRDDELNKIMENQRKEPARVARFNQAFASLPAPASRDTAAVPSPPGNAEDASTERATTGPNDDGVVV